MLRATDSSKEEPRFFFFAGLVTVMLLLDDLYMLHERVFLRYLGTEGWQVFSVYAVVIVAFVIRFRRSIARSGFWIFALGLAFFALSVGVDLLPDHMLPWHHLFEDGFKLLGIVSWFGYFANAGLRRVS